MTPDQKPSPRERGPYRDSRASGASSAAATRGNSSAMPNAASTRTATKRSGSVPRPTPPTTSATPTIVIVNVAESPRTTPRGPRRPPAPPADSTAGRTGSTHGLNAVPAPARNAKASRITMRERTVAVRRARFAGSPAATIQDGFTFQGHKNRSKWSTLYTEIPKGEATGKLDLRAECHVTRIEHDEKGLVTGVVYVDGDGLEQFQRARLVSVAGNAIETARLLLNSSSSQFPEGLANSSDQVGRNYMRHLTASTYAIFDKPVRMYRG